MRSPHQIQQELFRITPEELLVWWSSPEAHVLRVAMFLHLGGCTHQALALWFSLKRERPDVPDARIAPIEIKLPSLWQVISHDPQGESDGPVPEA